MPNFLHHARSPQRDNLIVKDPPAGSTHLDHQHCCHRQADHSRKRRQHLLKWVERPHYARRRRCDIGGVGSASSNTSSSGGERVGLADFGEEGAEHEGDQSREGEERYGECREPVREREVSQRQLSDKRRQGREIPHRTPFLRRRAATIRVGR